MNASFRRVRAFLFLALGCACLAPAVHANGFGGTARPGYISRLDGAAAPQRLGPDGIYDSVVDGAGNVYVVGRTYSGELELTNTTESGTQQSSVVNPNIGAIDAGFVTKYDRDGRIVWTRTIAQGPVSTPFGPTAISGVAVDSKGNVFVTGSFTSSMVIGSQTLVSASALTLGPLATGPAPRLDRNIFVAMLDPDGVVQWARQLEVSVYLSTTANANPAALAFGNNNDPFSLNFDPSKNVGVAGTQRVQAGTGNGRCLAVDAEGSVYLKAGLSGGYDFNTVPANSITWMTLTAAGASGRVPIYVNRASNPGGFERGNNGTAFLIKLAADPAPPGSPIGTSPTYAWRWIQPVSTDLTMAPDGVTISSIETVNTFSRVTGLKLDGLGSLYVSGDWSGLNQLGNAQRSFTARDGFVARLRTSDVGSLYLASYSNAAAAGGASRGGGLAVDSNRVVTVAGEVSGAINLRLRSADGTLLSPAITSIGANVFLGRLNSGGTWQWMESPGISRTGAVVTAATDVRLEVGPLAADSAGGFYLGGRLRVPPQYFQSFLANRVTTASFGSSPNAILRAPLTGQTGAGGPPTVNDASEAFVAKLQVAPDGSRQWLWVMQTDVQLATTDAVTYYDTTSLSAGSGGTVYWTVCNDNNVFGANVTTARLANFSRALTSGFSGGALTAAIAAQSTAGNGAFLFPLRADLGANGALHSPEFSSFDTIVIGREIPAPSGVYTDANGRPLQPEIVLPEQGNIAGNDFCHWDTFAKKLFAVRPGTIEVRWKVSPDPVNTSRVPRRHVQVWPTIAEGLITHVTGAGVDGDEPRVSLENPASAFSFSSILYRENDAVVTGAKKFAAKTTGYSVLLYTAGANSNPTNAPASLDVVRTYLWTDASVGETQTSFVGYEIDPALYGHADPSGKNGYMVNRLARYDGHGPGAAFDRDTQLGAIVPVNTDEPGEADDFVVIYNTLSAKNVSWPSKRVTFQILYPFPLFSDYIPTIVVASGLGSETYGGQQLDPAEFVNPTIYHQPDKSLPGYNPNEEHAFLAPAQGSDRLAAFALRNDLNNLGRTTSQPFVLLRYQDGLDGLRTKFKIYKVETTATARTVNGLPYPAYNFNAVTGDAGKRVQAPYPLSLLAPGPSTSGSGTAYFKDRKNEVWARALGSLTARYFYVPQPGFWTDLNGDGLADPVTEVPWLDRFAGTPGTPLNITYNIVWPTLTPQLALGDTLTSARDGLPDVEAQASTAVIFEGDAAGVPFAAPGTLARLFSYTDERQVPVVAAVSGQSATIGTAGFAVELQSNGRYRFRDLPFHLKTRVTLLPGASPRLVLGGFSDGTDLGPPVILPNILSVKDAELLVTFGGGGANAVWASAVQSLYRLARNPNGVTGDPSPDAYYVGLQGTAAAPTYAPALGPKALSAGRASNLGYLTIVENNDPALGAAPVALHIIRIVAPPVVGNVKVILADNALDEKVTLRHSKDFAGDPTGLFFEWFVQPAIGATPPAMPDPNTPVGNGWLALASGLGLNEVIIQGSGIRTLADQWVCVRYRGAGGVFGTAFTDFAGDPASTPADRRPALVQGWIKRVLAGINPFEARVRDFGAAPTQTYSSFVRQAGTRYEGAVALNGSADNLNNLGLIALYETVLRRGFDLSLNGIPPQTNDAVNAALLLAATRISDFYMLLGNEAYADAQDPTVGFTSADAQVGNLAGSVFAFQNQVPNLMAEELNLLRGRDNSSAGVGAAPIYNRLFWNFTGGIEGEPVYVQNYGITDQNVDGLIDEQDARILFPQGHGDAWGHYLTAVKSTYRLLRHPNFNWNPRPEFTTVAGVALQVDYLDERKFAQAAAARANAGAEIVNLTYREKYTADPAGQWQGYRDTDRARAWGVDDWARRAGQGAYLDWLAANSVLPAVHTQLIGNPTAPPPSGLQKIDRTTIVDLNKIAAAFGKIQALMDQADQGLNPLGLAPGAILFDIDPTFFGVGSTTQGNTHFEQVLARAVDFVASARRVFDYASELTNRLRQTQISSDQFAQDGLEQEFDYRNRLIEIFGYPYAGDIGAGKTFPTGYNGPDLYHYNYVPVSDSSGVTTAPTLNLTGYYKKLGLEFAGATGAQTASHYFDATPASTDAILAVQYPIAPASVWAFAAPTTWGERRAPGQLQQAIADIIRAQAELQRGVVNYNNQLALIQDHLDLLKARYNLEETQIMLLDHQRTRLRNMNAAIGVSRAVATALASAAETTSQITDATAEVIPKVVGLANDLLAPVRGGSKFAGVAISTALRTIGTGAEIAADAIELDKEDVTLRTEIEILKAEFEFDVQERLKAVEALVREEVGLRIDLFNLRESLRQAVSQYQITLAEGERILEERRLYRVKVAGAVQQNRYQDMTFRLFRNDALQKYRAAFDLAARYTYLASTAYDYETCQLGSNSAAGRRFLTDIVRERSLGQFLNDEPVVGVNGLSDPLARLKQNFVVLEPQLGIGNPQFETGRFSLREQLYRLRPESDEAWREQLQVTRVADLWKVPEFRRFCRPFAPESAGPQPGLVITFQTDITFGNNVFGLPLAGGDASYDSSQFATKIQGVGAWFANYDGRGLSTTPRVYLVPVGSDILRSPSSSDLATRQFDIVDQAIPVSFPVGTSDLNNPAWIPSSDALSAPLAQIRQFSRFRAYHDDGFDFTDVIPDTRLIGRSVWNTKWMLIIPGGTLLNNPNDGLDTFINGALVPGGTAGQRDGNGVKDIKIIFYSYSYSGN